MFTPPPLLPVPHTSASLLTCPPLLPLPPPSRCHSPSLPTPPPYLPSLRPVVPPMPLLSLSLPCSHPRRPPLAQTSGTAAATLHSVVKLNPLGLGTSSAQENIRSEHVDRSLRCRTGLNFFFGVFRGIWRKGSICGSGSAQGTIWSEARTTAGHFESKRRFLFLFLF